MLIAPMGMGRRGTIDITELERIRNVSGVLGSRPPAVRYKAGAEELVYVRWDIYQDAIEMLRKIQHDAQLKNEHDAGLNSRSAYVIAIEEGARLAIDRAEGINAGNRGAVPDDG